MNIEDKNVNDKEKYGKILRMWEIPATRSTDEAWADLSSRLTSTQKSKGRLVVLKRIATIAAAASVVVASVFFFKGSNAEWYTESAPAGTHREVVLPDGSMVKLNAGSSVSFQTKWDEERLVKLQGEAFFEVQKGSRFTVESASGKVEVLGTSFNVFDRGANYTVHCFTGKVKVASGNSQATLIPGEMCRLEKGVLSELEFEGTEPRWVDGEYTFERVPLRLVFDEIERQFNVKVESVGLEGRDFEGTVEFSSLENALETICSALGLSYEIKENMQVVVRAENGLQSLLSPVKRKLLKQQNSAA